VQHVRAARRSSRCGDRVYAITPNDDATFTGDTVNMDMIEVP